MKYGTIYYYRVLLLQYLYYKIYFQQSISLISLIKQFGQEKKCQNKNIINQMKKMNSKLEENKLHIKFNKTPIKKNQIYFLHEAQLGTKKSYVKVFNQSNITKYNLDDILEYNICVLNQYYPELHYQQNFLQIQETYQEEDMFFFATKPYEYRLDEYLRKKGPQSEKNALLIFSDIIKASFSLIMAGFYHRNLRPEHFVLVDNKWKLQSIVQSAFSQLLFGAPDSQYIYNSKFQPPEVYTRDSNRPFIQQEMDEWIVWDLGSILIDILIGHHVLKSQNILQNFKDQPFSFSKIHVLAGENKISKQLKDILGQMCHYNPQKRIKFQNLLSSGYFSQEIATILKQTEQPPAKKIFLAKSGSVSQSISMISGKSDKNSLKSKDALAISRNIKALDEKSYDISISGKPNNKIETKQDFQTKIQEILQNQNEEMGSSVVQKQNFNTKKDPQLQDRPNLLEITDDQYDDIINIFKNYINKVDILGIGAQKFKQILNIFENKRLANQLINLTLFAVNFYKSMELYRLAKSMNENKPIFKFDQKKWELFIDTRHYKALKKIVNAKYKQQSRYTEALKAHLKKSNNSFVKQKDSIRNFVEKCRHEQAKFNDFKLAYRSILKISYDEVSNLYIHNKTDSLANLGMYITFCLAIDKFYLPEEFRKNFDFFFKWSKKRPSDYVSLQDFQSYLDQAPRSILVENSRYIIQRFYEI